MQIQNLGTKINMKNNMMPNMNMNNMKMQIPNIEFQNQNMMMNNNILGMMNNQSVELNLRFEERNKQMIIIILPEKTIKEAIDLYKIKSGNNSQDLIFIFNGKKLYPDLKIKQSGLVNGSRISVINQEDIMGG